MTDDTRIYVLRLTAEELFAVVSAARICNNTLGLSFTSLRALLKKAERTAAQITDAEIDADAGDNAVLRDVLQQLRESCR